MFEINPVSEHIYHIRDGMGVCVTLVAGREKALLFDTGYGLWNLRACVEKLTALPLVVVLSHGHHDHALGYTQFETVYCNDWECLNHYTRQEQREKVLKAALDKGLRPQAGLPSYETQVLPASQERLDLGGITVQILPLPGHTPGSLGALAGDTLLIGDNWNPTTWVFFPECVPMAEYQRTMEGVLKLPFERVLASHCFEVVSGKRLRSYIEGLANWGGEPAQIAPYESINTYLCHPEPQTHFFYDRDKL